MDDNRIIELYFARDEQAIKETALKYGRLCYTIANNILEVHEDAEECVNDTYLGIWEAIPPTRPNSLMSFACKITRNLSLKRLELMSAKKRSTKNTVPLSEIEDIISDERDGDEVSAEEIGKTISRFLQTEDEDTRNIFVRRYFFCDSISDIAKAYSFTESKVKNMLFRTRKKLKAFLIKEGIEI